MTRSHELERSIFLPNHHLLCIEGECFPDCHARRRWSGPWCEGCDSRVNVGYRVPDDVWKAVVGKDDGVLCLTCFDELAQIARIKYEAKVTAVLTWSDWETSERS